MKEFFYGKGSKTRLSVEPNPFQYVDSRFGRKNEKSEMGLNKAWRKESIHLICNVCGRYNVISREER